MVVHAPRLTLRATYPLSVPAEAEVAAAPGAAGFTRRQLAAEVTARVGSCMSVHSPCGGGGGVYFTVHGPWGLILMCACPCLYITRDGPSRPQICRLYRRVYEEEEATSDAPPAAQSTVPILNRWVGGALLTEPA